MRMGITALGLYLSQLRRMILLRISLQLAQECFLRRYTRVIKPDQVTQQIVLPDTYVPSGQITIRVNDGKDPLPGTELVFGVSGGQSQKIITGNDGVYASESNLKEAEYTLSLFKEGYLYPENTIRISLDSDTTVLDSTFSLP